MDLNNFQEFQELGERLQDHLVEDTTTQAPFKQYRLLLPPDLAKEVQQFSKRRGMTMADMIRYSIRLYMTIAANFEPGSKLVIQTEGKPDQIIVIPF